MANPLPANWEELFISSDPAQVKKIDDALQLLHDTFPGRYTALDRKKLMQMMVPRENRPGDPGGDYIPGMRSFWRGDLAVFFTIRMYNPSVVSAYCMTVGVGEKVPQKDLYQGGQTSNNSVASICAWLKTDTGGHRLEIVNEKDLPGDIPSNSHTQYMKQAFTDALSDGKLSPPVKINPGYPWPLGELFSWEINP